MQLLNKNMKNAHSIFVQYVVYRKAFQTDMKIKKFLKKGL